MGGTCDEPPPPLIMRQQSQQQQHPGQAALLAWLAYLDLYKLQHLLLAAVGLNLIHPARVRGGGWGEGRFSEAGQPPPAGAPPRGLTCRAGSAAPRRCSPGRCRLRGGACRGVPPRAGRPGAGACLGGSLARSGPAPPPAALDTLWTSLQSPRGPAHVCVMGGGGGGGGALGGVQMGSCVREGGRVWQGKGRGARTPHVLQTPRRQGPRSLGVKRTAPPPTRALRHRTTRSWPCGMLGQSRSISRAHAWCSGNLKSMSSACDVGMHGQAEGTRVGHGGGRLRRGGGGEEGLVGRAPNRGCGGGGGAAVRAGQATAANALARTQAAADARAPASLTSCANSLAEHPGSSWARWACRHCTTRAEPGWTSEQ